MRNFEQAQGGEHAVAGGGVLAEDHVAGLLAAQRGAEPHHLLEHVLVADGVRTMRMPSRFERLLQAEVGHHGGDHGIAGQVPGGFQGACGGQQHGIAIHHLAAGRDEDGAVGIAVEGHAEIGAMGHDGLLQAFQVQRAAVQVDVAAVGLGADGDDVGAERAKQLRRQPVGCAVAAVDRQLHAVEAERRGLRQEIQVLPGQRLFHGKLQRARE